MSATAELLEALELRIVHEDAEVVRNVDTPRIRAEHEGAAHALREALALVEMWEVREGMS